MAKSEANESLSQDWINVNVDVDLKDWVRAQAASSRQSMSGWVRTLIERERSRDRAA